MSLVQLAQKGVHTVQPGATITEAACAMMRHSVGALVVTDASETTPTGVLTDRDLVAMIAKGHDPSTTSIDCLPRPPVQTVSVSEGIRDVAAKMRASAVRRLPIVDAEGHLIGLVSFDDVLVLLGNEMADIASTIETELAHEAVYTEVRSRTHRG